jgi:hypothetical protein
MKHCYHDFMKPAAKRRSVSGESEEPLQIAVPKVTKRSLRIRSAKSGDTMRVIVLRALAAAGIQVPGVEVQDRRKGK